MLKIFLKLNPFITRLKLIVIILEYLLHLQKMFLSFIGRNPHRWTCHFERLDNLYRYDCDYLTSLRGDFKQTCPLGCEISQVVVTQAPNRQFITIEFLVNCRCTRIPRRRRSINSCGFPWQFVAERATCTGFRNTN